MRSRGLFLHEEVDAGSSTPKAPFDIAPSGHVIGIDMNTALGLAPPAAAISRSSRSCCRRPWRGWSMRCPWTDVGVMDFDQRNHVSSGTHCGHCAPLSFLPSLIGFGGNVTRHRGRFSRRCSLLRPIGAAVAFLMRSGRR